LIIAEIVRRVIAPDQGDRILMLTHSRELISQNLEKLLAVWPQANVGLYSAGAGRKDLGCQLTYATIGSIWKDAHLLGRIDIVVNNAGQSRTGAFESITDAIWQDDIDLKLFAAIRLTRLVWPQMKERKWGRVINVLNTGAKAPKANGAPTHVTRAAGMALTKVLAGEGAPHGILVNALLVGLIVSDQIARGHAALVAKGQNISLEEHIARTGAPIPLGRMGKAEEFAAMACFLASEQGGYITGTASNVDGGASPVV
jgi:NAD(P)-dependent dehydrogenase (short-subunit alcohol dehydrogenase family)